MSYDAGASLGIVSVAIGEIYVRYWEQMITSADRNLGAFGSATAHVFTDRVDSVRRIAKRLRNIRVEAYSVAKFGWPEATMMRFKFFTEESDSLAEDILLYLDADMEIRSPLPMDTMVMCLQAGTFLVQHPGYYRGGGIAKRLHFYASNPSFLVGDVLSGILHGALGEWETRATSIAFVPRGKRATYVCGGVWMARRDMFLSICRELSHAVDSDLSRGVVARWHDESHLNRLHSERRFPVLEPSWCFVDQARNLRHLTPIVAAVEKGSERTR